MRVNKCVNGRAGKMMSNVNYKSEGGVGWLCG